MFKKCSIPWNKGLTKETDERVKAYAENLKGNKRPKTVCENISKSRMGKTSNFKGRHHKLESNKKNSDAHKNKQTWNKNLTKETDMRVLKNGKLILNSWNNKSYEEKEEIKDKISKVQKGQHRSPNTEFKLGNKTPIGNTYFSKGEYYKSKSQGIIWMRSGWEIKYAQFLDEHNILWTYENIVFPLILNNKKTTYRPDFYLIDYDIYIDVKGKPNANAEKIKQFILEYPDIKLQVLFKEDLINWGINLRYKRKK